MSSDAVNSALNVVLVVVVAAGGLAWVVDIGHRVRERMWSRQRHRYVQDPPSCRSWPDRHAALALRVQKLERDASAHGMAASTHWTSEIAETLRARDLEPEQDPTRP